MVEGGVEVDDLPVIFPIRAVTMALALALLQSLSVILQSDLEPTIVNDTSAAADEGDDNVADAFALII